MLDAIPDDWGDRGIANAGELESIGDALAGSHCEAACWSYRMASQRFGSWVASSTSGGEGLARSAEPDTAGAKLVTLNRGGGGP